MLLRIISSKGMGVIELSDVAQLVVMADTGEPVACAHETPAGAIITSHALDKDFDTTLRSLGMTPAPLEHMR